jgi:hypothetical protein
VALMPPTVLNTILSKIFVNKICIKFRVIFLSKVKKERGQRLFFRKSMASGSLFLGIDLSGRIDSAMELIPSSNRLLMNENNW